MIPGAGVHVISLQSALPIITTPVTLEGTSQLGYAGTPLIRIDGTSAGFSTTYALQVAATAPGSTIEGLDITNFSGSGILVSADGVQIVGNYLGITTTGALATFGGDGLDITTSGNTVGGTAAGSRNVISGYGVALFLTGSSNIVEGNYLGTNLAGTAGSRPTNSSSGSSSSGEPPTRSGARRLPRGT